ncbi:penicillin-binding protein 1A [uncultured Nitrosomonas sp.]|uniref:penicillin-binding protein 1A n=1 Tax=uncultured Nitrosomonas sp. TaxID=156424 RepID=UPI00262CDFB4|nr:penicillin-binding protein 1A [uncultured Nitrosomonas sp.]
MLFRWIYRLFLAILATGLLAALLVVFAALVTLPSLPSLETLTDYRPKIPLRIYSTDGLLIGEFGEERRDFIKIEDVPKSLKYAILAAEDDRFYQHYGVDYIGVLRAIYSNFKFGGVQQGASTITMQVARNFFLTKEKTLNRKFSETLLAFKIEHSLEKDKILELYINQIYLGQRSYGFSSAAQSYFGKKLGNISLAEAAMLAGLPKAPSRFNPVVNPDRAKTRQQYVLKRMRELGYISAKQYTEAKKTAIQIHRQVKTYAIPADYIAEMVRQVIYDRYGDEAYTRGIKVYTTLKKADQVAAYRALRKGVIDYDARHGYRGPEAFLKLPKDLKDPEALQEILQNVGNSDDILAAVVLSATPAAVEAFCKNGETIRITGEGLKMARRFLGNDPKIGEKRIRPGALIRVKKMEKIGWQIVQLPEVEAALIAMDPNDGAIRALVGGFDYHRNKFNHATQAWRQPGSSFKPFIYSAALEKGFTPATIINDAPLYLGPEQTGGKAWEPRNYDGKFSGPIRMRTALTHSKNLAAIRILQAIGPAYAQDYATRFGFDQKHHPAVLPMALGAGSATPMQMAIGYATFANGGYHIHPYFIDRIEDEKGKVIEQARFVTANQNAKQVIDPRNAFLMTSMMQDVIQRGTAARARVLGRNDIAGKTGTTSNAVDAWFCGYQKNLVAVTWMGFDEPKTMGNKETGGQAALPIWIDYMATALKSIPVAKITPPNGIVIAKIDPETGMRDMFGTLSEYFFQEQLPPEIDYSLQNPDFTDPLPGYIQ